MNNNKEKLIQRCFKQAQLARTLFLNGCGNESFPDAWIDRAIQVENEKITDKDFQSWLYRAAFVEPEMEMGEYMFQLASTFSP